MRGLFFIAALILASAAMAATQQISTPTIEDQTALERQRAVVLRFLSEEDKKNKYPTAAGKLGALRALLGAGVFKKSQTYELQSMGIVLGDAFVQDLGFKWIIVSDEYGRDPALQYRDTTVLLFPLTMISKRIERGEVVDVFDLYNGIAAQASERIREEEGGSTNPSLQRTTTPPAEHER